MLCKESKNSRRGAALVLALVAVLAASLLGVALMANTGNLNYFSQRMGEKMRAQSLAEASLGLAVQQKWVRGDTAAGKFVWPGAPDPQEVRFDTMGIWLRAQVAVPMKDRSLQVVSLLAKPLDTLLYRYSLVFLGNSITVDSNAIRLNGLIRSGGEGNPSSDRIRQQFAQLAGLVRKKGQDVLTSSFVSENDLSCRMKGNQRWWDLSDMPKCAPLRIVDGDAALESSRLGNELAKGGVRDLRVQGEVMLRGNLNFDTLRVYAEGAIHIAGDVHVNWMELYTKATLNLGGNLEATGILVGEEGVLLEDEAKIRCCSFVMSGDTLGLLGDSRIEGYTVAVPPSNQDAGVVRIASRAKALGTLYAPGGLENQGFVGGIALVGRFGCGDEGRQECVPDGVFDRDSMPSLMRQSPFLDFGSPKRYVTLQRSVY